MPSLIKNQFESDMVKHLCRLLGVKTHTTPYNPKSDGMVERFNRTLIDQLAKTFLSCEVEWDSFLLQVAFAYTGGCGAGPASARQTG